MTLIDTLNRDWQTQGLRFAEGPGGLAIAELTHEGASATVALHGAHVLSYVPAGAKPVLWLSKEAIFKDGKAIRGGIPVCWPWFADHPNEPNYPAHGVARTRSWKVASTDFASLTLELQANEATREHFPHDFVLRLQATLGDALAIQLSVHNPGQNPFTYTGALHTYFAVSHIDQAHVEGLDGRPYIDSIDGKTRKTQAGPIRFQEEVDRIYLETTDTCLVSDNGWDRTIRIAKEGSHSTVVWNPWIAKAQRMADFGDQEYQEMLCVETTNAADDAIAVPPGETHKLALTLSLA